MPIKQRPHLAWIVRFVPLAMLLVACAVLLILPQTRTGFIEGVKRKWEGEKTWEPVTSIIPEDGPMRMCGVGLSLCTTVDELERDPDGRAIIARHLPGFWTHPALPGLRAQQIGDVMVRGRVPPDIQRRIDFDLANALLEQRRRAFLDNVQRER